MIGYVPAVVLKFPKDIAFIFVATDKDPLGSVTNFLLMILCGLKRFVPLARAQGFRKV